MAFCTKCGAELIEGNTFCTKCGARQSDASAPIAMQRFCTTCGAPLGTMKFCTKCGAPAGVAAESVAPGSPGATVVAPNIPPSTTPVRGDAAPRPIPAAPAVAASAPPPPAAVSAGPAPKSSGIPKVAIVVLGVIVLLVVGVVVGVTYVVHRVRQKAAQLEAQAEIERSLAGLTGAANSAQNGKNQAAAADLAKALAGLAAAAQTGNNQAAVQDAQRKLAALVAAAQDPKTQAALQDLNNKLAAVAAAQTGQNPNNPASAEDINKDLAAIAAAANALGQGQAGTSPSGGISAMVGAASAPFSAPGSAPSTGSPAANAAASPTADTALIPPPVPSSPPMVPVPGTGDPKHDWPLEYERTVGGPDADLVVRTGDINNLGFGWPQGFDPFSGKSTPPHPWPSIDQIPAQAPPGTDRIMLGTSVMPVHMVRQQTAGGPAQIMLDSMTHTDGGDGYSASLRGCYYIRDNALQRIPNVLHDPVNRELTEKFVLRNLPESIRDLAPSSLQNQLVTYFTVDPYSAAQCTRERALTMPTAIVLPVGQLPSKINNVVVQIFADDFQPVPLHSRFQVSLNGTRIPTFEYAINSLDQTGPIGKLLTLRLLPEYWPLLKSGDVKLLIDDPTTRVQDGYAVDFVRILVNPRAFKYQVSLTATVTDADTHKPIPGAMVGAGLSSTATDQQGKCELKGIPAGLVIATASAPGYDENSVPVDLPAGQSGNADIQLHRHQESTAALEQSIAQTGTATIYGIHFDTGSSKLRADSMPALNAVLGLINGRPGSNWIIAGHTDNQGSDALNIPLSKARAASVVSWLTAHGVAHSRLEPQGFGSTRPVADNATASGRALNRRVEVSLAK
jgi:outer membrane protein OmpA-like peptidoglycan-associated protein